jgi:hypothetical protein
MNNDLSGLTQQADPNEEIAVLRESNRLLHKENEALREEIADKPDNDPYCIRYLLICIGIALVLWAMK